MTLSALPDTILGVDAALAPTNTLAVARILPFRAGGIYTAARQGPEGRVGDASGHRIWTRVTKIESGCWIIDGARNEKGYGGFFYNGRTRLAHRVAWIIARGPIPDGLFVCHHCDNPPCVKTEPDEKYPDGHLFLGTNADNMRDCASKGRTHWGRLTHCRRGHEFSGDNLRVSVRSNGKKQRVCLQCVSDRNREFYERVLAKKRGDPS